MKPISHLLERLLKLSPPLTRDVVIERNVRVAMPDGVELLADRWTPRTGGDGLPTALIRTPYGRGGVFGTAYARPLAERGYQVLIQSTRGGFGSGGSFDPFRHEREDGLATIDWVTKQPWFGDAIVLTGQSYLGYVQWAVADAVPAHVKAMIPLVSHSALTLDFLKPQSFSLETPFLWGLTVANQERILAKLRAPIQAWRASRALKVLPLRDADATILGHHSEYIQHVLEHDADDPFWTAADHRGRVADITMPVSTVAGWYDIFLPTQLRDFAILQENTSTARLTVGPWTHNQFATNAGAAEAIEFGLPHASGQNTPSRAPVRLFVMGENNWRDFATWPPDGYASQRFYLQSNGSLSSNRPSASAPDTFRYNPAKPTPAVGGTRLFGRGRRDNKRLESRNDVLTYTTSPLDDDVEIIGDVAAEIWFRSSLPYADVFVRLCDVNRRGRSYNVCDGLVSLTGADEISCATVQLWPTAYRFKRGHQIRVQVSSGAFPRYARNPGTGEPRATATVLLPAAQSIYHDPSHESAIVLPVRATT